MPEELAAYRAAVHGRRLDPRSTALVIVDLQYGSASREHGYGTVLGRDADPYLARVDATVVPAVRRLQNAFRASGAPVVFLTFGTVAGDYSDMPPRFRRGAAYWRRRGVEPPYARAGTRAMDVLDPVAPRPGEPVFVKPGASGFVATPLEAFLRERGVGALVICGVTTSYCVESTLRDAADRGFDVVLAEDACAELTPEMHERGVAGCAAFGRVGSSRALAKELGPR